MITKVEIQNCSSIVNASVKLSPFTLLIGANGSGKTNFLQIFKQVSPSKRRGVQFNIEKHVNYQHLGQQIIFVNNAEITYTIPQDIKKTG